MDKIREILARLRNAGNPYDQVCATDDYIVQEEKVIDFALSAIKQTYLTEEEIEEIAQITLDKYYGIKGLKNAVCGEMIAKALYKAQENKR